MNYELSQTKRNFLPFQAKGVRIIYRNDIWIFDVILLKRRIDQDRKYDILKTFLIKDRISDKARLIFFIVII